MYRYLAINLSCIILNAFKDLLCWYSRPGPTDDAYASSKGYVANSITFNNYNI